MSPYQTQKQKENASRLQRAIILNALTTPVAAYFIFSFAAPDVLEDWGVPVAFEGAVNIIFVALTGLLGAIPVVRAAQAMNEKQ